MCGPTFEKLPVESKERHKESRMLASDALDRRVRTCVEKREKLVVCICFLSEGPWRWGWKVLRADYSAPTHLCDIWLNAETEVQVEERDTEHAAKAKRLSAKKRWATEYFLPIFWFFLHSIQTINKIVLTVDSSVSYMINWLVLWSKRMYYQKKNMENFHI